MNGLKPIVAGCRAMVIQARNPAYAYLVGTEVTVLQELDPCLFGEPTWQMDVIAKSPDVDKYVCAPERTLMRIDGHEPELEKEQAKEVTA